MNLEVIWSEFAEKRLDEIFEYYEKNASERVAIEMVQGLLNEPERLKKKTIYRTKRRTSQRKKNLL